MRGRLINRAVDNSYIFINGGKLSLENHLTNLRSWIQFFAPDRPAPRVSNFWDTANIRAPFFYGAASMRTFSKPALSYEDMFSLLTSRGLVCTDKKRVINHLSHVSYYRLTGYAHLLYNSPITAEPSFRAGTDYNTLWDYYTFDRELRLLTLDAIERIEVSVRTTISDMLSVGNSTNILANYPCGPHWYLNKSFFNKEQDFQNFYNNVSSDTGKSTPKKRSPATDHYYTSYDAPELPPSWIVMEELTMGKWVTALLSLKNDIQKVIASKYYLNDTLFTSWVQAIYSTRNICAHHGRLLGRSFTKAPKAARPNFIQCPDFRQARRSYYAIACVTWYMLRQIVPTSKWTLRLKKLFEKYPSVDIGLLGFHANWKEEAFWAIPQTNE